MNKRKLLQKILSGSKNIRFDDMIKLAEAFGFSPSRIAGSHHIMTHSNMAQILNLQNVKGQVKPYQVRQFLKLIEQFNLKMGD